MPSFSRRPPRHRARRGRSTRSLPAVLAALTVLGGLGAGMGQGSSNQAAASAGELLRDSAPEVRAAAVLRSWDRARAEAWHNGDAESLSALYVGAAGQRDVGLLREYADRGYRVRGLRTQLLSLDVLRHERDAWWLRVTDRLAGGVAVRGGERVALPRDHADSHTLLLVRSDDGRWRMAVARPA